MANKLDITTLFTDGSARVKRITVDPKTNAEHKHGSAETTQEIELYWPELDITVANALIAAKTNQGAAALTALKVNGDDSISGTWLIAGQPRIDNERERTCTLYCTLTSATYAGVDFPYEDRSDTAFWNSSVTKSQTAQSAVYINAKYTPTLAAPFGAGSEASAITNGSLSYRTNKFGRTDGIAHKVTYAGTGSYNPSADDEVVLRAKMQIFSSPHGNNQGRTYVVRTKKKYFASGNEDGAKAYAQLSDVHPFAVDPTSDDLQLKLGYYEFNESIQLFQAYKIELDDGVKNPVNYSTSTF